MALDAVFSVSTNGEDCQSSERQAPRCRSAAAR
jgi:hypothetical protein